MNNTYTNITNHLNTLAEDNNWEKESVDGLQDNPHFRLSYAMVSRGDDIEPLLRGIPGLTVHYCRAERNTLNDYGPYLDRAIIQVDERVFHVEMYWPEWSDDECDATLTVSEVCLHGSDAKSVVDAEIKNRITDELSALEDLIGMFPHETLGAVTTALKNSVVQLSLQQNGLASAIDRLSYDVEDVAIECDFKVALENSPQNGLLRLTWDINWGYDDSGSNYPYASHLHFIYASGNGGEYSISLNSGDCPDLDNVPDADLSAMTGFPVIDDDTRDMVLGYYCEVEPLFGFDVSEFENTLVRAWRQWGTLAYVVDNRCEQKEAA